MFFPVDFGFQLKMSDFAVEFAKRKGRAPKSSAFVTNIVWQI